MTTATRTPLGLLVAGHPRLAFEATDALARDFLQRRIAALLPEYTPRWHALPEGAAADLAAGAADRAALLSRLAAAEQDAPTLVLTLQNPLLDADLARQMLARAVGRSVPVQAEGAVPGTAPLLALPALRTLTSERPFTVASATQRRYGTQVNLVRLKRVKQFRALVRAFADLHTWSIARLLDFCGSPAGVEFLLRYGEDISLERYAACPLCAADAQDLQDLHSDNGHPVMGFFTRDAVYYQRCHACGLVFLNPVARKADLHLYYDVYETESVFAPPIAETHAALGVVNTSHYLNYEALFDHHGDRLPRGARVADLGGGRGEFCVYACRRRPDLTVSLIDHAVPEPVRASLASYGVEALSHDLTAAELPAAGFDLITMWEVIEHLRVEDLAPLLARIARALAPGGLFCLSTPDFDNPYGRALDFWAMAPGHHVTVLSRRVLAPLLAQAGFTIVGEHHECVTMKLPGRWFRYGAEAHTSLAARAEAAIIDDVLRDDAVSSAHQAWMRRQQLGSELILVAQRG